MAQNSALGAYGAAKHKYYTEKYEKFCKISEKIGQPIPGAMTFQKPQRNFFN